MKKHLLKHVILLSSLFYSKGFAESNASLQTDKQDYLIKFHSPPILDSNEVAAQEVGQSRIMSITVSPKELQQFYNQHQGEIEYVEPNYEIELGPDNTIVMESLNPGSPAAASDDFYEQWALENSRDTDVDANESWNYTQGSPEVVVAIIDSGVDLDHPELEDNIWTNHNEVLDGVDNDDNGYIDDIHGWDYVNKDNKPDDDRGHGTHCAGIIAAKGERIVGLAPKVKIMPLKFLGSNGKGSTKNAIKAIYYAVNNGAKIINNSWGGTNYSQALEDAIAYAHKNGVVVTAAAGNQGRDIGSKGFYPASLQLPNLLSIANLKESGSISSKSNYSQTTVHLAAPGSSIISSYKNGTYAHKSGTSMAAPYVSAALALLYSYKPEISVHEAVQAVMANVQRIETGSVKTLTHGTLKAAKALSVLDGTPDPFDLSQVSIERSTYKRSYQVLHRIKMRTKGPKELISQIEKISYTYQKYKGKYKTKASKMKSLDYYRKLKTRYPTQPIRVQIELKSGRVLPTISVVD